MPVLRFWVGLSPAAAAGTCIIAVFFTTLGGSIRHYRSGYLKLRPLIPVIVSGAVFTVIFSLLFAQAARREYLLDLGIAAVFLLVSLRMTADGVSDFLKKTPSAGGGLPDGRICAKTLIGAAAGIFPGLLGIGTGAILVPAFRFILKAPIKTAIASSLACFAVNAAISSAFKIIQGFSVMGTAIAISAGAFAGSLIGVSFTEKSRPAALKILFGIVFFLVSIRYTGLLK